MIQTSIAKFHEQSVVSDDLNNSYRMSMQHALDPGFHKRVSQSIGIAEEIDPQALEEYYFDQRGDDENSGRKTPI